MPKKQKPKKTELPTFEEFDSLVKSANSGDTLALARLRRLLDGCPEIWERVGDLAEHAQAAFITAAANGNKLLSDSLTRKAQQMRGELLGAESSRIETLTVERVVATSLEVEFFAAIFPASATQTAAQLRLAEKIKTSAQRRLDAAMKSFCLVKKLLPHGMAQKKPTTKLKIAKLA